MAPSPPVRQASSQVPLHHVQGRSCRPPGDIALLRQQFDDLPIRPADKESSWPVPYDQLFDQYVEADLLDLSSDNTGEGTNSDDLVNFFDISSSSNGSAAAKTSPMPNWDPSRHTEPEDAWQQDWGYIGSNVAPAAPDGNQTSILPDSGGMAAPSAPELFSLDALPSCPPQVPTDPFVFSAPSSPRPIVSTREPKKFNSLPIRGSKRQTPSVIRRSVSKGSFSPKMMRSTPYRTGYQEIWAKRVGAPPLSPPPSTKVSQDENNYGYSFSPNLSYTTSGEVTDIDRQLSFSNFQSNRAPVQMTPVASPTTQETSSARSSFHAPHDPSNNPYLTHDLSEALQTPPQSSRLPSSSWSQNATAAFDFGSFSASSDYSQDRAEPQPWWANTSVSQPSQHNTYHNGRSGFMAVSTAPSDLATNGLMIQCEPSSMNSMLDAHAPDASFSTSSPLQPPAFGAAYSSSPGCPAHTPPANHPSLPQPHLLASSKPRPPPLLHAPARLHRPLPPRLVAALSAPSSRPRSHHRRKSSSHSSTTGPSVTPRPASVGFVNYTPDDSRKILTGVAPSGSSKTKARREKEAAEKRRRLSQAAARAIIEAGGDLAALEREGLLCLPEAKEMLAARGHVA
ncbi:hypothetical protein B0J12DRAFT_571014 [Macrophomina phaseolina]|uniref:Developmental regulatory protein wetA n=1 Tax=Macrophomina phaseolina TaxID=35725 RepID=A0ABQ8GE51_9PEZI|nr:hypothetical protein B0J12DRAFT_571014 [Macrophomina phaseolina]